MKRLDALFSMLPIWCFFAYFYVLCVVFWDVTLLGFPIISYFCGCLVGTVSSRYTPILRWWRVRRYRRWLASQPKAEGGPYRS